MTDTSRNVTYWRITSFSITLISGGRLFQTVKVSFQGFFLNVMTSGNVPLLENTDEGYKGDIPNRTCSHNWNAGQSARGQEEEEESPYKDKMTNTHI